MHGHMEAAIGVITRHHQQDAVDTGLPGLAQHDGGFIRQRGQQRIQPPGGGIRRQRSQCFIQHLQFLEVIW